MAKKGRPSAYTKELANNICEIISNGKSARQACIELSITWGMLARWLDKYPDFREQYAKAREILLDYWSDDLLEISDNESRDLQPDGKGGIKSDNTAVNRDRLKIDTRKWAMSKLNPKKYGDVTKHELTGADGKDFTININLTPRGN